MPSLALHLTERARRGQMIQHASPALMLVVLGMESLLSGNREHVRLDVIGIIVGFALLYKLKREFRGKPQARESKVNWLEILAGVAIILEGAHRLHPGKTIQPGSLAMLIGVAVILMGIFHHRLESLRRLEWNDQGFYLRARLFRTLKMNWADIQSIDRDGNRLIVTDKSRHRHTRNLRRIANRDEVFSNLESSLAASRP